MDPIVIRHLPPSKSFVNRLLAMAYLSGSLCQVEECLYNEWDKRAIPDDINLMLRALKSIPRRDGLSFSHPDRVDCGAAGTVLRFTLAIAALTAQDRVVFEATERLKNRPLTPLIESLKMLGAKIVVRKEDASCGESFLEVYPSVLPLKGGISSLELGRLSSQFITALLLIAPYLSSPLFIPLPSDAPSKPYISLTLEMMAKAGALFTRSEEGVLVQNKPYDQEAVLTMAQEIEGDWSAASYIYGWLSLLPIGATLSIPHLGKEDRQGDRKIADLMEPFGVKTHYQDGGGVVLHKIPSHTQLLYAPDLKDYPDLLPALLVTTLMHRQPFHFAHVGTLRWKESDRLSLFANAALALGFAVEEGPDFIAWNGEQVGGEKSPLIPTSQDHRIPMAWSIALLKKITLSFDDAMVVTKSYPLFWEDAALVGVEK